MIVRLFAVRLLLVRLLSLLYKDTLALHANTTIKTVG